MKLVRGEGERALWRCTTIHLALHWVSAQEPAISGQALPSANCATPPSPFTHPTSLPPTIFGAKTDTQSMSSNMSLVESPAVADQQSACKKSVSIVSCWYSLALSAVRAVFRLGHPWPSPAPSIPQLHGKPFAPWAWLPIPRTYLFGLPGPPTTHMMGLRQQARVSPPLGHPATLACPQASLSGSRPIMGACERAALP